MFNNFGFEGSKILKEAEIERYQLHHPYVGSEHLVLALLKRDSELKEKLKNYNLTYEKFREELINIVGIPKKNIDTNLYTPLLKRVLASALNDAKENNKGIVSNVHLLLALLDEGEGIAIRIMLGMGINLDDLYDELKIKPEIAPRGKLELYTVGTILNDKVDNSELVVGRDREIDKVIEVLLRKKKSNPLLIGPAGVGKTAIVEELARRIKNKQVPPFLENMEIIELPMGDLVSGTKYRGEFEERLTKIIKEVIKSKNIILFIDEVHSMVNAGGAEGAINASDILKPYLARGELRVIGATTTREYEKYILKDKALERRFEKVLIKEPNLEETKVILEGIKNEYVKHHGINISEENISDIVNLANKYLFGKKNPDKTLDLLDSICAYVKRKGISKNELKLEEKKLESLILEKEQYVKKNMFDKALDMCLKIKEEEEKIKSLKNMGNNMIITKEDILKVIEDKSNVPMFLEKDELIKKIEDNLQNKVYFQNEAIKKLVNNLKYYFKSENNLKILLVGPSGCGKTSSVKVISEVLNNNLIRLDMSEYNLETSVNKLIGVSHGYVGYDDDFIFNKVRYNPYSIILVDEIEKAHPSVLNLFLQIMDEGFIHDSHGELIDFSHTLIFMTSNAYKNKTMGFGEEKNKLDEIFTEEFLGRFDEIIDFKNLEKEEVLEYIDKNIKNKDINKEELLKEINYQKYGFRYVNKVINKYNLKINI